MLARRQFAPNLFHSATAMRSRLKVWNESGTKRARIADSSRNPIRSPQHLALKRFGATLDQVYKGSTSGGVRVKSLKAGVESEVVKSQDEFMLVVPMSPRTRPCSLAPFLSGDERSSRRVRGSLRSKLSPRRETPHPGLLRDPTFSHRGERGEVYATLNSSSPPLAASLLSRTTSPPASPARTASGSSCGREPGRGFPRSARRRSPSGVRWRDI